MGTLTNSEDPDEMPHNAAFHQGSTLFVKVKLVTILRDRKRHNWELTSCDPLKYIMEKCILIAFICMGKSIRIKRVNKKRVNKICLQKCCRI